MWICRALSLPRILRQRRHRCLKIDDEESSPAISAALSDGRITVTFGGLPAQSANSQQHYNIHSVQHLFTSLINMYAYCTDVVELLMQMTALQLFFYWGWLLTFPHSLNVINSSVATQPIYLNNKHVNTILVCPTATLWMWKVNFQKEHTGQNSGTWDDWRSQNFHFLGSRKVEQI